VVFDFWRLDRRWVELLRNPSSFGEFGISDSAVAKIAAAWDEIAPIAGHQQTIPSTRITSLISVKEMGFAALDPSCGLTID
jgi:hypothetical protein